METKLKSILCTVLFAFVFAGCDLFEMRGFILSYETVNERFEQSMEWNTKNPYREIPAKRWFLKAFRDSLFPDRVCL